jgi:hypothetical protein
MQKHSTSPKKLSKQDTSLTTTTEFVQDAHGITVSKEELEKGSAFVPELWTTASALVCLLGKPGFVSIRSVDNVAYPRVEISFAVKRSLTNYMRKSPALSLFIDGEFISVEERHVLNDDTGDVLYYSVVVFIDRGTWHDAVEPVNFERDLYDHPQKGDAILTSILKFACVNICE